MKYISLNFQIEIVNCIGFINAKFFYVYQIAGLPNIRVNFVFLLEGCITQLNKY